jgi:GTPase Era involved in 16S rRNA processing
VRDVDVCGGVHAIWPQRTDQSLLEQAEELIREKIFQRTNGDVPYRVSQENLAWYTSNKDASYVIHHNILVPNVRVKVPSFLLFHLHQCTHIRP